MEKNNTITTLTQELKKLSLEKKAPFWKRIATELEKPSRNKRVVNLWKIEKVCKDDETIIVPGKVLGDGNLNKKVTVVALNYSKDAKKKLTDSKVSFMTNQDLMKKNPEAKGVRIIG